jgi:hypothetical protein
VSYRRGTFVYSWADGNIISSTFSDATAETPSMKASDIHQAFDSIMGRLNTTTELGTALSSLGLGSNKPVIPFWIFLFFNEYGNLAPGLDVSQERVMTAFQSLLAIPIFFSQAQCFDQLSGLSSISNLPVFEILGSMLPDNQPHIPIFPVKQSYSISVRLGSLIPFIVLGGITLLLCVIALLLPLYRSIERPKGMTGLPILDHEMHYKRMNNDGQLVTGKDLQGFGDKSSQERVELAATLRVFRADQRPGYATNEIPTTTDASLNNLQQPESTSTQQQVEAKSTSEYDDTPPDPSITTTNTA